MYFGVYASNSVIESSDASEMSRFEDEYGYFNSDLNARVPINKAYFTDRENE